MRIRELDEFRKESEKAQKGLDQLKGDLAALLPKIYAGQEKNVRAAKRMKKDIAQLATIIRGQK